MLDNKFKICYNNFSIKLKEGGTKDMRVIKDLVVCFGLFLLLLLIGAYLLHWWHLFLCPAILKHMQLISNNVETAKACVMAGILGGAIVYYYFEVYSKIKNEKL